MCDLYVYTYMLIQIHIHAYWSLSISLENKDFGCWHWWHIRWSGLLRSWHTIWKHVWVSTVLLVLFSYVVIIVGEWWRAIYVLGYMYPHGRLGKSLWVLASYGPTFGHWGHLRRWTTPLFLPCNSLYNFDFPINKSYFEKKNIWFYIAF